MLFGRSVVWYEQFRTQMLTPIDVLDPVELDKLSMTRSEYMHPAMGTAMDNMHGSEILSVTKSSAEVTTSPAEKSYDQATTSMWRAQASLSVSAIAWRIPSCASSRLLITALSC
eukprot:scaffold408649_cov26-Prasinocladus_malaysianus.AAC.1